MSDTSRVVSELRKELLLDRIREDYISDEDLLKQTKGTFLVAWVKLRLALKDLYEAVRFQFTRKS